MCCDYLVFAQDKNGATRSVIIANGDTLVNGKKLNELSTAERDKLRREFKDLEKRFRTDKGPQDIVSKRSRQPNVLYWNDDIDEGFKT